MGKIRVDSQSISRYDEEEERMTEAQKQALLFVLEYVRDHSGVEPSLRKKAVEHIDKLRLISDVERVSA